MFTLFTVAPPQPGYPADGERLQRRERRLVELGERARGDEVDLPVGGVGLGGTGRAEWERPQEGKRLGIDDLATRGVDPAAVELDVDAEAGDQIARGIERGDTRGANGHPPDAELGRLVVVPVEPGGRGPELDHVAIPYERRRMPAVTPDRLVADGVRAGEYGATVRDGGIREQTQVGQAVLVRWASSPC
jgi:hypothetical protein